MPDFRKKVAVTGSLGFLGSPVSRGFERRGVDLCRHARIAPDSVGDLVAFDLADPPSDAYQLLGDPETIVHLAWGALEDYDSIRHFELELPLHFKFLKKMVEAGVRKVLVSGTCFEYGRIDGCLNEERKTDPANSYGFAKDSLRRELTFLKSLYSFDLVWTRLFYLYGDGQPVRTLFGQLGAAITRGEPKFPMTSGEQLRDYLSVEEAADAICRLSLLDCGSQIVNICSGNPRSVRSLVEGEISRRRSAIVPAFGELPYSRHEAMAFWGSRKKLNEILGE